MLYRRKLLLSILKRFGGALTSLELQKYLFLLSRYQAKPCYDFVPHKQGSYSFLLRADLAIMEKQRLINRADDKWTIAPDMDLPAIKADDQERIANLSIRLQTLTRDQLMAHTYREYPEYAIRSQEAARLLNQDELLRVNALKPTEEESTLFSIGYEGLSLDAFIHKLICNNVSHLCDVRKNAFSMKYGFSKSTLKAALQDVCIGYTHHPELGIVSEQRKDTKDTGDWQGLFNLYQGQIEADQEALLPSIADVIRTHGRVALMCFEHSVCDCHRGRLLKVIDSYFSSEIKIVHL